MSTDDGYIIDKRFNGDSAAFSLLVDKYTIAQHLVRAVTKLKEEMMITVSMILEKQKLQPAFTFRIVELIQQTKIEIVPPARWLPWGPSLAIGLILTLLSFTLWLISLNPIRALAALPIPSNTRVAEISEISVDAIDISGITFTSHLGNRQFDRKRKSPNSQNAIVLSEAKVQVENEKTSVIDSAMPKKPSQERADAPELTPVCTAPGVQYYPQVVGDGENGIIVIWIDLRTEMGWNLYAQRIDCSGKMKWQADGVAVCHEEGTQRIPYIVWSRDKAIVVWQDKQSQYYAQAINRSGEILYQSGVLVTKHVSASNPALLNDGEGGVLIIWSSTHGGSNNLYLQRLDADGEPMWQADGVPLFPAEQFKTGVDGPYWSNFVSDNNGGFYITWSELTDDGRHITAHRFDRSGKPIWRSPTVVAAFSGNQVFPFAASDGQGGLLVVWQEYDQRNFISDNIYVQRIDSDGRIRWTENGMTICDAPILEQSISFIDDGRGGIVAVWQDDRDIYPDLYAQRISADGKAQWEVNGSPICAAGGHQTLPVLTRSGKDQFFVAWVDYREDYSFESHKAIYAQQINLNGETLWAENGILIFTADGDVSLFPFVLEGNSGELKILWSHEGDIYMQHIR